MFKSKPTFVSDSGIVFMEMADGSYDPYVSYNPLAEELDEIGVKHSEVDKLVLEGYAELIRYNKGEKNG